MDRILQILIQARNQASPSIHAVTTGAKQMTAAVAAGNQAVAAAARQAGQQMTATASTAHRAAGGVRAAFGQMGQGAQGAARSLHNLERVADGTFRKIRLDALASRTALLNLGGAAGPLLGVLAGAAAAAGVGALAKRFGELGVQSNTFRENTLAALTAITKSRQEAESLFGFMSKFADVTPFDDEEVIRAGQALLTFGMDARRSLTLVGDTAAAMKVPLDQVVNALAKLKAGSFDMAEMAPVGITREGLEGFGIEFTKSGEPKNRDQLLGAGEALLSEKFGGTMGGASAGMDARFSTMISNFRRVAMAATTGLFESLKNAFEAVSRVLEGILANGKLVASLKTIFDAVGKAIEGAAARLPDFVAWLEKVASADGIRLFLINVAGLVQTVGETVAKVFGFDIANAMDPKKMLAWFDQLGESVAGAINTVFGLARVWQEVQKIVFGSITDLSDRISDMAQDISFTFKGLFLGLQKTIHSFAADLMEIMVWVLDGLNEIAIKTPWGKIKPFNFNTDALEDRMSMQRGAQVAIGNELYGLGLDQQRAQSERRQREAAKDAADPFRRDDPWKRISDAFSGAGRDMSAQDAFWKSFERNRLNIARALFGGTAAPSTGIPGMPPSTQLYGRGGGGAASVTVLPNVLHGGQAYQLGGPAGPGEEPTAEVLKKEVEYLKAVVENSKLDAPHLTEGLRGELLVKMAQLIDRLHAPPAGEEPEDRFERLRDIEAAVAGRRDVAAQATEAEMMRAAMYAASRGYGGGPMPGIHTADGGFLSLGPDGGGDPLAARWQAEAEWWGPGGERTFAQAPVNVSFNLATAPLDGRYYEALFRDPAFLRSFQEFLNRWRYENNFSAFPSPVR